MRACRSNAQVRRQLLQLGEHAKSALHEHLADEELARLWQPCRELISARLPEKVLDSLAGTNWEPGIDALADMLVEAGATLPVIARAWIRQHAVREAESIVHEVQKRRASRLEACDMPHNFSAAPAEPCDENEGPLPASPSGPAVDFKEGETQAAEELIFASDVDEIMEALATIARRRATRLRR